MDLGRLGFEGGRDFAETKARKQFNNAELESGLRIRERSFEDAFTHDGLKVIFPQKRV